VAGSLNSNPNYHLYVVRFRLIRSGLAVSIPTVVLNSSLEAPSKSILIIYIKPTPDGGFTALQRQQVPAVYLDMCVENHCRIAGVRTPLRGRHVSSVGIPFD
jgi:hypothetical protein